MLSSCLDIHFNFHISDSRALIFYLGLDLLWKIVLKDSNIFNLDVDRFCKHEVWHSLFCRLFYSSTGFVNPLYAVMLCCCMLVVKFDGELC